MNPSRPPVLRCELCGGLEFDPVPLHDTGPPGSLRACRGCRLVYLPRPGAAPRRGSEPEPPDLSRYGPDRSR